MAELSYPLDLDEYIGARIVQIFHAARTTGVYSGEENLSVVPSGAMSIRVNAGAAWIHHWDFGGVSYVNDSPMQFLIAPAHGVLHRIDRVVVRYSISQNKIGLAIKAGVSSSSPAAPAIQRDADVYELALANVMVNAGTIAITQSMIADQRMDESVCGIVRDGVAGIPTQALYDQWRARMGELEADWDEWVATLKDILSGEVAGNLQLEIDALQTATAYITPAEIDDLLTL